MTALLLSPGKIFNHTGVIVSLCQPTSYHGGRSGRLVLLRRRRDVLADLLGDVRREHAVVPRAADPYR